MLNSAGFLSLTIHAVSKDFTISSTRKYRRSRSPRFCSLSCSTGFLRFRYRDVYIALDVSAPTDNNNPARLPAKKRTLLLRRSPLPHPPRVRCCGFCPAAIWVNSCWFSRLSILRPPENNHPVAWLPRRLLYQTGCIVYQPVPHRFTPSFLALKFIITSSIRYPSPPHPLATLSHPPAFANATARRCLPTGTQSALGKAVRWSSI